MTGSSTGELVDHLFRHEAGKMTAVLVRVLGLHNIDLAEDIVQETLCRALETWKLGKTPENPAAWLMSAAKNRAIDTARRLKTRARFAPDIQDMLSTEWALVPTVEALFREHEIADDQLRMMFSCCHPDLTADAQVTVILKYLGGFSVREIAQAFLTSEAAIEKRLNRAKKVLAEMNGLFEVSGREEIAARAESVRQALYLLFNEGYHGSHSELAVREELCAEAIRLTTMLADHPATGAPASFALLALMCLHAARLPARVDDRGSLVLLEAQDRSRWSGDLIANGIAALERSACGDELTAWHVEAAIAAKHCEAPSVEETDWRGILSLYDLLARLRPSPAVALNRAIVVGRVEGPERGLAALEAIEDSDRLTASPFFATARADLLLRLGRDREAKESFETARRAARNPLEASFLDAKLASLGSV